MPVRVLGIDVGGTSIKAAFHAAERTPRAERAGAGRAAAWRLGPAEHATRVATPPDATAADALAGFAERLLAAHGPVDAVGLAIPGIVDDRAGVAEFSVAPAWSNLPLRDRTSARLGGVPVALGHDVRLGGLAEGRIGAAAGCGDYLFLALGTGVGGMLCLDARPRLGPHHRAAEIGHVIVEPGGAPCGCGQHGCLETIASATGIARLYRESGASVTGAAPDGEPPGGVDAREVARRAAAGEARAAAVWRRAIDALATALVTTVTVIDLELVVVGGGVAGAGERLLAPLRERLAERLTFQRPPRLVAAALGDEAAVSGAALHALDLLDTSASGDPPDPSDPPDPHGLRRGPRDRVAVLPHPKDDVA